jgi:PilZ domain
MNEQNHVMSEEDENTELRIARRNKVLKAGKILIAGNLGVVDCTIRDMSETGARIVTGDQMAIPNAFRLVVPMDNIMREAIVKWRRGTLIGIAFTGEAKRPPPRKW